jgi:hypothetical protein
MRYYIVYADGTARTLTAYETTLPRTWFLTLMRQRVCHATTLTHYLCARNNVTQGWRILATIYRSPVAEHHASREAIQARCALGGLRFVSPT